MWIRHFWYPEKRLNCFQCFLNPGWMFLVRFFRWSKLMGTLLGFDKVSLSQQTKDFCLSRRAKHLLFYGGCRRWPGKCIAFVSLKHGSSKSSHYKLCWSGKIQWICLHFVLDRFVYFRFTLFCSRDFKKKIFCDNSNFCKLLRGRKKTPNSMRQMLFSCCKTFHFQSSTIVSNSARRNAIIHGKSLALVL